MANNFKPSDLIEIIVVHPPRSRTVWSGFGALQRTWNWLSD